MADGFDIHFDKDRARKVEEAARSAGLTPEAFVPNLVDQIIASDDGGWEEDMARLAEYDRTGIAYSIEEVFDPLRAKIQSRMAERR
jgi:hypothetical protein